MLGERHRWIRTGSVFVRAAHLLGASAVAGAYLLGVEGLPLRGWWILVAISGVLLLLAELVRHPELWREVAGWATLVKLVLIGLIPAVPGEAAWLMGAAIVVAALGAHLPKRWRHKQVI
jgi:hypothetical protein